MKIDFELLAKQKQSLLTVISTLDPDSDLQKDMDGILHLIDALQDEQEDGKKEYFFLFGESVSKAYHEEEFDEVMRQIKEEGADFAIFNFTEGQHPTYLLDAADGWMGTAEVTKEEYEQLKELEE